MIRDLQECFFIFRFFNLPGKLIDKLRVVFLQFKVNLTEEGKEPKVIEVVVTMRRNGIRLD